MNHTKNLPVGEKKTSATSPSRHNATLAFDTAGIAAVVKTLEETGLMDLAQSNPEEVLRCLVRLLGKELGEHPAASKDSLWTRQDVASYAQCSIRHVDAMTADKKLVPIKMGRLSRFDPAAVKAAFAKTTRARRGRG